MTNTLTSTQEAMEPLKYLTTINLDTIWQFYQPALETAFINEELQGNIDKETKKTLQRMRFKWINSRVSALENTVQGEETKSHLTKQIS